jgi:hypothetical protein
LITRTIFFFWELLIMRLLITQSSPIPCYQIPLRMQYLPQHTLLEHFQLIYDAFAKPNLILWSAILAVLDVTDVYPISSEQRVLADDKATVSARRVNTCLPKCMLAEFHIYSRRNPKLAWISLDDSGTPKSADKHESFQIKEATCSWRNQSVRNVGKCLSVLSIGQTVIVLFIQLCC